MTQTNKSVSGNRSTQNSFLDVCLAIRDNVMRELNVAEVVQITKVDEQITAKVLSNPQQIVVCDKLQDLDVQPNDVMLVIFTNSDFRPNLNKIKKAAAIQKSNSQTLHSINYGILVGLIYRNEQNGGNNDTE